MTFHPMTFQRKLARLIIRGRYILLAVVLLCAAAAVPFISRTRINYDLTDYLAKDTITVRGLHVMWQEFGAGNQLEDSGDAANESMRELQEKIAQEIPIALMIAVAVVLLMLLATSRAWLEPLLITAVLALSILLNMGTNFIFPKVSFITFAICPILQLALSIDYAIMLLHAYDAFRDAGLEAKEAMTEALAECFMRISSSAMTTVAGLLSLLFMSFTIGFDIGLVLSKGILFSMLGVFTVMPSLTLLLGKALQRTKHKPLPIGGDHLGRLIHRIRKPLAVCMALLTLGAIYLNTRVDYNFSGDTEPSPIALIVPGGGDGEDLARQRELLSRLKALEKADGAPSTGRTLSMVSEFPAEDIAEMAGISPALLKGYLALFRLGDPVPLNRLLDSLDRDLDPLLSGGAGFLEVLTPFFPAGAGNESADPASRLAALREQLHAQAAKIRASFIGPRYSRLAVYPTFTPSDDRFVEYMGDILDTARDVCGEGIYATGVSMSTYDINNSFNSDRTVVNLITLAAIFLIVALSFRSLRMAVVLVLVIESAIWMNMACSALIGEGVFFISYLICLAIQMGATIDYGILLSDQYRARRAEGLDPREAVTAALKKALPTILTSGVILVVAGFAIGKVCTIYYINSIGLLVSRGALISVLLMLTFLPALLTLCDRFIIRQAGPRNG